MRDGFVKAAALTPRIRVADCEYNTKEICAGMEEAWKQGAKLLVFPELCVTGYTCGDLFLQETLLSGAERALERIVCQTEGKDGLVLVGLPFQKGGKLYNTAAAISGGRLLGLIPKRALPNYSEFYERRHFERENGKCSGSPGKESRSPSG